MLLLTTSTPPPFSQVETGMTIRNVVRDEIPDFRKYGFILSQKEPEQ